MAFVYCDECGREISDRAKFCPQCGCTFKINGKGFAITSMVLGIVACTACSAVILFTVFNLIDFLFNLGFVFSISLSSFTIVLSVLSLIFALVSKLKGSKLKKTYSGFIMGGISLILSVVCFILNIVFLL